MSRVTAVVLTYNRRDLVQDCLRAILAQSRKCDDIIVVNNASTDDTLEVLRKFEASGVRIHSLDTNIGAAGGFSTGIRLAYEGGADFLWVMDDDVIPDASALEELQRAYNLLETAAVECPFVISSARSPSGLATNVPEIARELNSLAYQTWPRFLSEGLMPVSRATFVSVLFPRATVDRYGLPISDMFIWGEDSEYTLRITRRAPGYFVGRSSVEHVRAVSGVLDLRTERDPTRIRWHRLRIRNDLYISRKYRGRVRTARHALRTGRLAIHFVRSGQLQKAAAVISGIMMGLTFHPQIEPAAPRLLTAEKARTSAMAVQAH